VIVSSAIRETNPELAAAKAAGLRVLQRAELLAKLMDMKEGIAIAGTHGKTTTTSMAAVTMESCGLDPTYLIGGELNDIGSGARQGHGSYVLAEADESDASLLYLNPKYAVVTNVEADHLDFYDSIADIKKVFKEFLNKLPEDGRAIICADSPALVELLPEVTCSFVTYGIEAEDADYRAVDIQTRGSGSSFEVIKEGRNLGKAAIEQPGRHNVANALAVIVLALELGQPFEAVARGVGSFTGVRRRFQVKGVVGSITVVDDYAHHPSEVAATLNAAKAGGWNKIVSVFQPHRYSRTSLLSEDFGAAFAEADRVVVTDVYGAGEEPLPGVDGKLIVDSILEKEPFKDVAYFPRKSDISGFIAATMNSGDILLTMGAGDIWTLGDIVLEELRELEDRNA
jgi:UDP-N-acetylmuramate--alanine ligase